MSFISTITAVHCYSWTVFVISQVLVTATSEAFALLPIASLRPSGGSAFADFVLFSPENVCLQHQQPVLLQLGPRWQVTTAWYFSLLPLLGI